MLHKVVDEADVILGLDARDPAGCRSRLVEEEVRGSSIFGCTVIYCDVDLVLRENAQVWLKHTSATQLRRSHSALSVRISVRTWHLARPRHCSGLSRRTNLARRIASPSAPLASPTNVGKSSLINTLKRAKVRGRVSLGRIIFFDACIVVVKMCAVAAQPRHTKELQSVQLGRSADRRFVKCHI
jgi:nuclear GTP-binding protein